MKRNLAWMIAPWLVTLATVAFLFQARAVSQSHEPRVGRYQISMFPGRQPQFGYEAQGIGCHLVDTATGELWHLSIDSNQNPCWRHLADPIR